MTTETAVVLQVGGLPVRVLRKRVKHLRLAVYPPDGGGVRVSAPMSVSDGTVRLFVIDKMAWIKRQQRFFAEQPRQGKMEYVDGESHYFLGRRYLLKIESGAPAVFVEGQKTLRMVAPAGCSAAQRAALLAAWYKQQMQRVLPGIVAKWEAKTGLAVGEVKIRRMKTRWGTCLASKRKITLNLELMKRPLRCLEYVVAHEMAHFWERHHNRKFYDRLEALVPQWRQCHRDLTAFPLAEENWNYK